MTTKPREIPSEAKMNRGYVTVYEQTLETEKHDEGDRFVLLGHGERRYKHIETEDSSDFVVQAIPIAEFELPEPLDSEEDLEPWSNSDVGKALLAPFFDELDAPEVLTEWGKERADSAPSKSGSSAGGER